MYDVVNVLGQLEDQIQERKYHDIVQSLAVRFSLAVPPVAHTFTIITRP